MQVIVFASQKGGAGKTTLAVHLAVAAEAAGMGPVVMLDMDPQGTMTSWWNNREADLPALVGMPHRGERSDGQVPADLAAVLQRVDGLGFKLAVIDTPPAITGIVRPAIAVASLVVVPVRPSPADLWAVGGTLDICRAQARPFVFAVAQATARSSIAAQARLALAVHGPVAPEAVHNRVAFAGALTGGSTAQETDPKGTAAREIASLLAFVRKHLDGGMQTRKAAA